MPRPRPTVPTYRKHSSGRAVVSVYKSDGTRTEVILPGAHGGTESKTEYERLLSQLRVNDGKLPAENHRDLAIAELVLRFVRHADTYYVDPTTKQPTSEIAALDTLSPR